MNLFSVSMCNYMSKVVIGSDGTADVVGVPRADLIHNEPVDHQPSGKIPLNAGCSGSSRLSRDTTYPASGCSFVALVSLNLLVPFGLAAGRLSNTATLTFS